MGRVLLYDPEEKKNNDWYLLIFPIGIVIIILAGIITANGGRKQDIDKVDKGTTEVFRKL